MRSSEHSIHLELLVNAL